MEIRSDNSNLHAGCLFPDRYRQNYCDCLLFAHLLFCNKKPFSSWVCLGIGLPLISMPQGKKNLGESSILPMEMVSDLLQFSCFDVSVSEYV